jgi:hypothetical protein
MNIEIYQTLISNLPVRQQSFTTKRSTWIKAENEIFWLSDFNDRLFDNQETLNISRKDIFNSNSSIKELVLKAIYWGYPSGMRGSHFVNILQKIQILEQAFSTIRNKDGLTSSDFSDLTNTLKKIAGIGLSTYSKLLYFSEIKFNGNPCLILDQRLIDVFASQTYNNFSSLSRIAYANAEKNYLEYLELINQISFQLSTKGENIEQFLFMFGNNLKT